MHGVSKAARNLLLQCPEHRWTHLGNSFYIWCQNEVLKAAGLPLSASVLLQSSSSTSLLLFPVLRVIHLQYWGTRLVAMQGDLEHWFCESTHAGEMKNQNKIREFHFSVKCNRTAIKGGEGGEMRGPHMNTKYRKINRVPVLFSWKRFCLPLNLRAGIRETADKPVWTNTTQKLWFIRMKVLEARTQVNI